MQDIMFKGMNEKQVEEILSINYCSGIYAIICRKTNKVYIGQSENVRKRINAHFSMLQIKKHNSEEMQKDYNKYSNTFYFYVIRIDNNKESRLRQESFYIDLFRILGFETYNKTPKTFDSANFYHRLGEYIPGMDVLQWRLSLLDEVIPPYYKENSPE